MTTTTNTTMIPTTLTPYSFNTITSNNPTTTLLSPINIYSFDLDDTIIPTSQHINNLTPKHFSHLLPPNHTHPNNDPYQTLKDLKSSKLITDTQFNKIFLLAHSKSLNTPFPHMISFINNLKQTHIHIVTAINSFYKPSTIIKKLSQYFPNKTIRLHNPSTHTINTSSTDFIQSNSTKENILLSLHKTFNITHFVDGLPFLFLKTHQHTYHSYSPYSTMDIYLHC